MYVSKSWYSMPMAKQARQIWTEKLGLVHPHPLSGVIFREIGHLATIPIFSSNQCKKVQIIKHEWTPEIYKIKLYCIVSILYRMHTKKPKKIVPLPKQLQSAWRYYCFPCAQNHTLVTKIPSRQTNATDCDSRSQPNIWSCKCKFKWLSLFVSSEIGSSYGL